MEYPGKVPLSHLPETIQGEVMQHGVTAMTFCSDEGSGRDACMSPKFTVKVGVVKKLESYILYRRSAPGLRMQRSKRAIEAGDTQKLLGRPAEVVAETIAQRPLLNPAMAREVVNWP